MSQSASQRPMTIFFSSGEPSGDVHGANLIRALRERCPALQPVGYGGPRMGEAGCTLHADLTALAVMWFVRAILNIHKFWGLYRRARAYFRDHRPDAVVLIDYPGFNWWIARAAKAYGIPVFYYVPPQIWAWARWRVKKMRRLVDHVLCALPFEQEWYAAHGCNATLVGHPFFDEVRQHRLDHEFIQRVRQRCHADGSEGSREAPREILRCAQNDDYRPLVTILPGSRNMELANNLRWLLKAAQRIRQAVPSVRFAVAAFKPAHAEQVKREAAAAGLEMAIHTGRTPELIHAADCCLAVSGSVSLELLYHTRPTVILYWVTRRAHWLAKRLIKVKYITLVNLITADDRFSEDPAPYDPSQPGAEQVLFPEYPTCEDKSEQLAAHVIGWLTNSEQREALVARLTELKARVCRVGAAGNAAEYVLRTLHASARASVRRAA